MFRPPGHNPPGHAPRDQRRPRALDRRVPRAPDRAPRVAAYWLDIREHAYLKGTPRAALLRLERQVGLAPRSLLASIACERVLVACVPLVLLCLVAIRSAPQPGRATTGVAMP